LKFEAHIKPPEQLQPISSEQITLNDTKSTRIEWVLRFDRLNSSDRQIISPVFEVEHDGKKIGFRMFIRPPLIVKPPTGAKKDKLQCAGEEKDDKKYRVEVKVWDSLISLPHANFNCTLACGRSEELDNLEEKDQQWTPLSFEPKTSGAEPSGPAYLPVEIYSIDHDFVDRAVGCVAFLKRKDVDKKNSEKKGEPTSAASAEQESEATGAEIEPSHTFVIRLQMQQAEVTQGSSSGDTCPGSPMKLPTGPPPGPPGLLPPCPPGLEGLGTQ